MFIHAIFYVGLLILSSTAVFASGTPISKTPREQKLPETERETPDVPQP